MAEFQLQSNDMTLYQLLDKLEIGKNRCAVYVVGENQVLDTFTVIDLFTIIGEHCNVCIQNSESYFNTKKLTIINVLFNAEFKKIDIFVKVKK